ncbi:hypothetical protein JHJ32_21180 [Parapedobacter sp. ISTM3]|uniref:hypothetical protein n=1 Tax=Parapedobacter sp. ISTM3 TaxID=2800130 RepID=UPI0019064B34|nr:hypothetical protein [Parapedobacter sp. ISTM3]MBK1442526.1 hypothetical protein [Parapedobacter sp. ISTM3]
MKQIFLFLILCLITNWAIAQTSGSATSGTMGWKRIAHISGQNGRGFGRVTLYTVGMDYQPIFTTVDWFHDWSNGAGIRVNSDSPTTQYWNAVRITDDGTNSYIEVNFLTTVSDVRLISDNYGWRVATLYTGTLPAGGGNQRAITTVARFGIEDKFTIRHSGNIGIGTSNPQAKLAVNGNILAKEVKVKTDISVPDYVFAPEYDLPALADVEAYVKEHRHLPEIPSAMDIERDGLDLAEMNLLLLKKVEELTLHLIEKDKQLKDVLVRVDQLESLNKTN